MKTSTFVIKLESYLEEMQTYQILYLMHLNRGFKPYASLKPWKKYWGFLLRKRIQTSKN